MSQTPIELNDPLDFPLFGSRLIEASAGTGKTYTIAALYVRLVIQHGLNDTAFGMPLQPRNILVMTFTKAATAELSDRIRARLSEAANHFRSSATSKDSFLETLRAQASDSASQGGPSLAAQARLLELASQSMDEAAVSTIHGWCHKMLREHAFASGSLFDQNVQTDDDELRLQAAEDYFRELLYNLDAGLAEDVLKVIPTPTALRQKTRSLQAFVAAQTQAQQQGLNSTSVLDAHQQRRTRTVTALENLKQDCQRLLESLQQSVDALPDKNNITDKKAIAMLGDWCASQALVPAKDVKLNLEKLAKKLGLPDASSLALIDRIQPAVTAYNNLLSTLESELLVTAKKALAARFEQLQQQRAELGHDDMLTRLRDALAGDNGDKLAAAIRAQYPIAMVDEFQDTDPVQYEIFNRIYNLAQNDPNTGIFLIGDPKQAIYSFRNADIYTYLKARRNTQGRHYTLATNYRSSQAMVDACNALFKRAEDFDKGAFLFKKTDSEGNPHNELPFLPVAAKGLDRVFVDDSGEAAAALTWSVNASLNEKGKPLTKESYIELAATHHANTVSRLLNSEHSGFYATDADGHIERGSRVPVRTADIAILVANAKEAGVIRKALHQRNIKSVYLSERDSVYAQPVARDLLDIIRACAQPRDASLIRSAVATRLLGLPIAELLRINQQETAWEAMVERFIGYHTQWQRQSILAMLHQLLHDFSVPAHCFADQIDGERELADTLHLAELLQQQSMVVDGMAALVASFSEHIREYQGYGASSSTNTEAQQLRLESDAELVKVITIHKSKGLQYPLVFLPFAAASKMPDRRLTTPLIYHDQDEKLQVLWDRNGADADLASDEIKAEDIRKMYVALTRAQYATFVTLRACGDTFVNPLFYLLGQAEPSPELTQLVEDAWVQEPHTQAIPLADEDLVAYQAPAPTKESFTARMFPSERQLERWWVASYSALKYGSPYAAVQTPQTPVEMNTQESFSEAAQEQRDAEPLSPAPKVITTYADHIHQLPKGAGPGTFLHALLEDAAALGFATVATDAEVRAQLLQQKCRSSFWQAHIENLDAWLVRYLTTAFELDANGTRVSLADLSSYRAEPEFWFPTAQVSTLDLDRQVQTDILPGYERPSLETSQLNGMLKGFIDLMFEHQGKYYVADYKSNWLGEDDLAYNHSAMREKILSSRYDLQYVLYTLALHKLLKVRLGSDYDYDQHVGGAVYLFLRGHRGDNAGAFYDRPSKAFIERLAALMDNTDSVQGQPHD